jgi:opacity protein-like surface antigen
LIFTANLAKQVQCIEFGMFYVTDTLEITHMKKLFLAIGLAFSFLSFAQQADTDAVVKAFKSANTEEIAQYFDDYIDLKLLDKEEVKNIGRNQAGLALKMFFDENNINGFDMGSNREIGSTLYITGKLTSSGKPYNMTVMLKAKGGKHQIITIRIN